IIIQFLPQKTNGSFTERHRFNAYQPVPAGGHLVNQYIRVSYRFNYLIMRFITDKLKIKLRALSLKLIDSLNHIFCSFNTVITGDVDNLYSIVYLILRRILFKLKQQVKIVKFSV